MLLWVGLGNPGAEHARQRHNIGFMALDAIAHRHGFSPWRQRFKGLVAEGNIGGTKVLGLKPMTYMNVSGESVQAAAAFYKLPVQSITAFHDELDLVPGKVRVKRGGGAAGHNGLRDMQRALGTPEFWRVRLGIGHPGHKDRVTGHVLGNYAKAETDRLADMLGAIAAEAQWLAKGDDARFMNDVALRMQEED